MYPQIHKQKLSIRDTPTRSVTIYPTTAAVVRDIPGIYIKPGINEYKIHNISGYADPDSFQVTGFGTSATIVNTSTQLLRAPPFGNAEALTSDSNGSSEDSDDDDQDDEFSTLDPKDREQRCQLEREIEEIHRRRTEIQWHLDDMEKEIGAWEMYGRTVCSPVTSSTGGGTGNNEAIINTHTKLATMTAFMEIYTEVRTRCNKKRVELHKLHDELEIKHEEALKQLKKIDKKREKQNMRAQARRERDKAKRRRKMEEKQRKIDAMYPQMILTVMIEAAAVKTPRDEKAAIKAVVASGRPKATEEDIENAEDDANKAPENATAPSLRISYNVSGVRWCRKFELSLDTVNKTGVLVCRAEVENFSGEDWIDASLSLSTQAQQRFFCVGLPRPILQEWKIGLEKKEKEEGKNGNEVVKFKERNFMLSKREQDKFKHPVFPSHEDLKVHNQHQNKKDNLFDPRGLFGPVGSGTVNTAPVSSSRGLFGTPSISVAVPPTGGLFGGNRPSLFGGSSAVNAPTAGGGLFGSTTAAAASNPNAPESGGSFGGNRPSLFGGSSAANAPATGGVLFGSTTAIATSNSNVSTSGGLFGSAPAAATTSNTASTGFGANTGPGSGDVDAPAVTVGPIASSSPFSGALFGSSATSSQPPTKTPQTQSVGLFGSAAAAASSSSQPQSGGLFGSSRLPSPPNTSFPTPGTSVFGASTSPFGGAVRAMDTHAPSLFSTRPNEEKQPLEEAADADGTATPPSPSSLVSFDPSARFTHSGATTTAAAYGMGHVFTVAGRNSIPHLYASHTPLRFMLSSTPLESVVLKHLVTPKYSLNAHLSAHVVFRSDGPDSGLIPTPSRDWPVAITVDGANLGKVYAACPGPIKSSTKAFLSSEEEVRKKDNKQFFDAEYPIGLDSTVGVYYAEPKEKVIVKGYINKSKTIVHTRRFKVWNQPGSERGKVMVEVKEQIPIVDEAAREKVKLRVLKPEGLQEMLERSEKGVREEEEGDGEEREGSRSLLWEKFEIALKDHDGSDNGEESQKENAFTDTEAEKTEKKHSTTTATIKETKTSKAPAILRLDYPYKNGVLTWVWEIEPGESRTGVLQWQIEVASSGSDEDLVSLS